MVGMTYRVELGRPIRIERGVGCASIVPAGCIGIAGLTDGAGPRGWLGLSELLGWLVVCIAVGFTVGALLAQWRRKGWRGYAGPSLAILVVGSLTWVINWLGLGAPMQAKNMFTSALQILGSVGTAAVALWFGYILWTER